MAHVARSSDSVTTPSAACLPRRVKSSCAVNSVPAEIPPSQAGEIVQELLQRLVLTLFQLRKAVKGIKWPRLNWAPHK